VQKYSKIPFPASDYGTKLGFFMETLHNSNKMSTFAPHFHFGKVISSVMAN
jgi:hypothetical protein